MNKMITATIKIGHDKENGSSTCHVAYGVDENCLFGAAISMVSVLMHNKMDLHFHILTDYVEKKYIEKCKEIADKFSTKITIYLINNKAFDNFPTTRNWSTAIYYRFIAFDVLSYSLDKVLYLDADIICKEDLSLLFETNIIEYYAAVIPDLERVQEKIEERSIFKGFKGKYFNSGVILANLHAWKLNHFTNKVIEILNDPLKRAELRSFDQDLLNILFFNHCIFLDRKYNCIYDGAYHFGLRELNNYRDIIRDDTVLIHYTSDTKPWLKWVRYPGFKYFDEALELSPWSKDDLMKAKTITQLKKKSKHEIYQGHYLSAVRTQCEYIFKKIFN